MAHIPKFRAYFARSEQSLHAVHRLRYDVFVDEMGAHGGMIDHENRLERDEFDIFCDHLVLCDDAAQGAIVGTYRMLRTEQARNAGRFYSENEYDLAPLIASGKNLLELGRSCLHRDYRGGAAMVHIWNAIGEYINKYAIEVLFGVASFHGTDVEQLKQPLSLLHARHLAPPDLRVRARGGHRMDLLEPAQINRRAAMQQMPPLIKAYLRLGGTVGKDAYIDQAFNTTDVCLILETHKINPRQRSLYERRA